MNDSYSRLQNNKKYYILFGPPGAGKGTQAGAIVERFNLCHISTGELLRSEIAAGTELGKQAKALIDDGNFVPDEMVEAMIEAKFRSVEGVDGFLLDGFPRTVAQADALKALLAKTGESVTACVSIMIPDELVHERIAHPDLSRQNGTPGRLLQGGRPVPRSGRRGQRGRGKGAYLQRDVICTGSSSRSIISSSGTRR